jgi:hypothetical protein
MLTVGSMQKSQAKSAALQDPRTTSHDANGAAPAVHFCSELAGA